MKHAFKGRLLHLVIEKRRFPNGYVGEVEIIRHPGAVLIVPFLSQDKVVMIRQYRPVFDKFIYEFPAGTLEKKESLFSCARREIVEETGYRAGRIIKTGVIYPVPGYSTEIITIFKAEGLTKAVAAQNPDEVIRTFIFTRKQTQRLFQQGRIKDAKSICALAFCGII